MVFINLILLSFLLLFIVVLIFSVQYLNISRFIMIRFVSNINTGIDSMNPASVWLFM